MNKAVKRLFVFLIAAVTLIIYPLMSVSAETESLEVKEAKNGIVQVNVSYVDPETGRTDLIQGGSGFLIGDDSTGAQTVITNFHVVNLSNGTIAAAKEYFQTDNLNTRIEVVVKGDVVVPASIENQSESSDYAILHLDQPLQNKKTLCLDAVGDVTETETVFALGFPEIVTWIQDNSSYTSDDVTIISGTVSKLITMNGVEYIQHNATLTEGNSGGPLLNSDGVVIGVNTFGVDDTNFYSLQMKEITEVLDTLGIVYETNSSGHSTTTATEATEKATEDATVTEATTEATTEVTTATESSTETLPVISPDVEGANPINSMLILILVVVVIIIIAIAVVIIVLVTSKSKKQAQQPVQRPMAQPMVQPPRPATPVQGVASATPPVPPVRQTTSTVASTPRPMPALGEGAGETSVLNVGAGETSVLSGVNQMPATLIRVKTGEKVSISRQVFKLGKERNKVDYCITNNNSISRNHANIVYKNGEYYVVDLNSTNNTFVNGQMIRANEEVKLTNGDTIKLSDEEFQFKL